MFLISVSCYLTLSLKVLSSISCEKPLKRCAFRITSVKFSRYKIHPLTGTIV